MTYLAITVGIHDMPIIFVNIVFMVTSYFFDITYFTTYSINIPIKILT
jgi:hypothetical protein